MSFIWYLENVNLFSLLCPHKFKEYKRTHSFDTYNKDDYIYFQEDSAKKIYLIEKGKVKTGYYLEEGKEIVNSILMKGELFGEKAILGEEKRNEFAQCMDDKTSICLVDVNTLHMLMRDNKNFSLKIYKILGFRFKKLERRLQLLLFKDIRTRFLEFLTDLCEEYGQECSEKISIIIEHPYTQNDIASLIGSSRPTLNILMNDLKKEKIIDFDRKQIRFYKK